MELWERVQEGEGSVRVWIRACRRLGFLMTPRPGRGEWLNQWVRWGPPRKSRSQGGDRFAPGCAQCDLCGMSSGEASCVTRHINGAKETTPNPTRSLTGCKYRKFTTPNTCILPCGLPHSTMGISVPTQPGQPPLPFAPDDTDAHRTLPAGLLSSISPRPTSS